MGSGQGRKRNLRSSEILRCLISQKSADLLRIADSKQAPVAGLFVEYSNETLVVNKTARDFWFRGTVRSYMSIPLMIAGFTRLLNYVFISDCSL